MESKPLKCGSVLIGGHVSIRRSWTSNKNSCSFSPPEATDVSQFNETKSELFGPARNNVHRSQGAYFHTKIVHVHRDTEIINTAGSYANRVSCCVLLLPKVVNITRRGSAHWCSQAHIETPSWIWHNYNLEPTNHILTILGDKQFWGTWTVISQILRLCRSLSVDNEDATLRWEQSKDVI